MTDLTTPAEKRGGVNNESMAHAMSKAGGHDGYVVDGSDLSPLFPSLDESGVNGFAYAGNSGLDATFDGGEAFLYGWLCRDRQTTVSLPANSTVTISVGFDVSASLSDTQSPADSENVLLGINNNSADNTDFQDGVDPQLDIWEVTTDGSTVTDTTDIRPLGRGEASAPWASDYEHPSTLEGRITVRGDFRDHIRIERSNLGHWDITPTTRAGNGLLFSHDGDEAAFNMTESHELITDDDNRFAKSKSGRMHFEISSSEPDDYDVWFEVS